MFRQFFAVEWEGSEDRFPTSLESSQMNWVRLSAADILGFRDSVSLRGEAEAILSIPEEP
jgi:hypothetical protein